MTDPTTVEASPQSLPVDIHATTNSNSLDGQIIVVTGATGTTGKAVCKKLQQHGALVIATSRRIEGLEQLQLDLPEPLYDRYVVDLSDSNRAKTLFEDISIRHHGVDAVVHLVGGWRSGGVGGYDEQNLRWLLDQLVVTTANVVSAARSMLHVSGGKFIHVSSPATSDVTARNAAYASAKAAADIWAASLARSFDDRRGTVTTFEVKALYDDAAVEESPDISRSGHTHVDSLAQAIVELWTTPAQTSRVSLQ